MEGPTAHHSSLTSTRPLAKALFWVALTISLAVFTGTPSVGPSVFKGSTESFADGNNKRSTGVEERVAFFPDLFEPSQKCIDLLYGDGTSKTDTAACNCSGIHRTASVLSFVDVPTVLSGVAPYVVDVLVSSPGSGCSDILEALFLGKDSRGRQFVFLGRVEALGEDNYRIMGKITSPGAYELRVRTLWKDFSPLSSCRSSRSCLQEEPWSVTSTNQVTLSLSVRRAVATLNNPSKSSSTELRQGERSETGHSCQTMDELLDGVWVWNASLTGTIDYLKLNQILSAGVRDPVTNKKLKPILSSWSPNTCSLKIFNASYLQTLFQGKHLHFVGDSTMHELLRLLMILFGAKSSVFPKGPGCRNQDRVFDSKNKYPVRFSFAWAGGPHPCDNRVGIEKLVEGAGREEFVRRYQKDADYVLVNAGLHDVSAGRPVEAYTEAIPSFFDLLLSQANVTGNREHIIWLSSNPKIHSQGKCPKSISDDDSNGGLLWMNYLAGRIARTTYGLTVMDSHRLMKAAYLAPVPQHGKKQCGDGHHCMGCDSCWAKALILVQYMVFVLAKAPKYS